MIDYDEIKDRSKRARVLFGDVDALLAEVDGHGDGYGYGSGRGHGYGGGFGDKDGSGYGSGE